MKIVKAVESDSEQLSEFINEHILYGDFDFRIKRSANFFEKYQLRSDDFETYFIRAADGKISACASLVFEEVFIDSQLAKVCWLLDLRIGADRKSSVFFAKNFFKLLFERSKEKECEHIFSIIFKDKKHGMKSLIRPKSRDAQTPQFLHMKDFQMLSIHGKLPSFQGLLSSIKIKTLNTNRLEELCLYLNSKSNFRLLGTEFSPDLLMHRLNTWPGLDPRNFFVAYDKRQNIVGCYAFWDPAPVQKLELVRHGGYSKNFYYLSKLLSWFGLARPTTGEGKALDFYHMTHLYCDNSDIFELLLHHAFQRTKKKFLVYPQFEDHLIRLPPKQFLHQNLDFGLYTILPHGHPPSESLRQNPFAPPPDIEMWSV